MIRDKMCFDDFCDFYNRRDIIRDIYSRLPSNDKRLYKYYVYSRRVLKEKVCDMIWGYLNVIDEEELIIHSNRLDKEYARYMW